MLECRKFILRLSKGLEDNVDKIFIRDATNKLGGVIDDGLGDAHHTVALDHIHELFRLYHVRGDMRVDHCKCVGRTGQTGAVRSGRRDKHL